MGDKGLPWHLRRRRLYVGLVAAAVALAVLVYFVALNRWNARLRRIQAAVGSTVIFTPNRMRYRGTLTEARVVSSGLRTPFTRVKITVVGNGDAFDTRTHKRESAGRFKEGRELYLWQLWRVDLNPRTAAHGDVEE